MAKRYHFEPDSNGGFDIMRGPIKVAHVLGPRELPHLGLPADHSPDLEAARFTASADMLEFCRKILQHAEAGLIDVDGSSYLIQEARELVARCEGLL